MCLGIPGKIVSTFHENELLTGKVDFGGVSKQICLAYVPEAKVGEYVIVHVGFALSLIDEVEAHRVFQYLAEMNELGELGVGETDVGQTDVGQADMGQTGAASP